MLFRAIPPWPDSAVWLKNPKFKLVAGLLVTDPFRESQSDTALITAHHQARAMDRPPSPTAPGGDQLRRIPVQRKYLSTSG
jgi:hypothetical protein